MYFTVEEENLICMYHKSDRRRTMARLRADLPDMVEEMWALARQALDKLDAISDADFEAQQFHFTDE
ncbi:transposon-transfer assisting family protein [Dysosmobacter welbionis]